LENNQIVSKLTEKFQDKVRKLELHPEQAAVAVESASLPEVAQFIKGDQDLALDYIMSISGVDLLDNGMEMVYHFCSTTHDHRLTIKVKLDREKPEVPTIIEQFPGANWYEREAWDTRNWNAFSWSRTGTRVIRCARIGTRARISSRCPNFKNNGRFRRKTQRY
jgi:NADH:ubiquinone oxidoreductase subunit C